MQLAAARRPGRGPLGTDAGRCPRPPGPPSAPGDDRRLRRFGRRGLHDPPLPARQPRSRSCGPGWPAGRLPGRRGGFIPVTAFRWHFSKYTVAGKEDTEPDAWVLSGFASHGADGLSGYSGIALSPNVDGDDADRRAVRRRALHQVRRLGRLHRHRRVADLLDRRPLDRAADTDRAVDHRPGRQPDRSPSTGRARASVIFDGVIVRAPVTPGRIGVEVENLGHMGHRLSEDSAPADPGLAPPAALRHLGLPRRPTSGSSPPPAGTHQVRERLRERAACPRRASSAATAASCLIADPSPAAAARPGRRSLRGDRSPGRERAGVRLRRRPRPPLEPGDGGQGRA